MRKNAPTITAQNTARNDATPLRRLSERTPDGLTWWAEQYFRNAVTRIFHHNRFLCRAICAELAGETIALRDIIRARNRRRRDLRETLQDRSRTVEGLLKAHRGEPAVDETAVVADPAAAPETNPTRVETPRVKRYIHE
jgi:hypothetical protein